MAQQVGSLYVELKAESTQLKRDLAQVKQQLEGTEQQSEKTERGVTGLGVAMKAALGAAVVQQVVKIGTELAGLGMQAESARKTFEAMGGTTAGLDQMRQATRGMVDDISAMESANMFLMMGLAETTDEAANLAQVATQLGVAMGNDATASMENFALMMANQSILRLDSFGISSGKVRERMAELKAETKGMTSEAAFMAATMEEAEKSMSKLGDVSETTAGQMAKASSGWQNLKTAMGESLTAGGGMGKTGAVLGDLSQSMATHINVATEARRADAAFQSQLDSFKETADVSKGQLFQLNAGHQDLHRRLMDGKITIEQYEYALQGLGKRVLDTAFEVSGANLAPPMSFNDVGMGGLSPESVLPSPEAIAEAGKTRGITASEALFAGMAESAEELDFPSLAEQMQTAMDEALGSEEIIALAQETGDQLKAINQDVQSGLSSVTEDYAARRAETQFRFETDQLVSRAKYENEYAALVAAGREEDAEKLKANFEYQQAMREWSHRVDEQETERALLVEKITKLKAYIEQQRDLASNYQTQLGQKVQAGETFGKLEVATQENLLEIMNVGGTQQVKQEVGIGEARVKANAEANKAMLGTAVDTYDAMLALGMGQRSPAQNLLGQLQQELKQFKIELPPMPEYDLSDIGGGIGGGSVGSAARQATEPATKALADVNAQIAKGIASAKQSIADLLEMDMPAGVDDGLQTFKDFTIKAVDTVYDLPADTKEKAKELVEVLGPLGDVADLVNTDLSNVKWPGAAFGERMDAFTAGLELALPKLVSSIETLRDSSGDILPEAAEAASQLKDVAGLLDLSKTFADLTTEDVGKPVRSLEDAVANLSEGVETALGDGDDGLMGMIDRVNTRWGAAIPKAQKTTGGIRGIFEDITATVTSVKDALKQGGLDVLGAQTLFDQMGALLDPNQGVWSASVQNLAPGSGYADWQTGRASREGQTGAPMPLPQEHTIHIKTDQGILATITAKVLGAIQISQNDRLGKGLAGSLD